MHSYRELPLRLAEFGSCHRNEPSGALHGIMRVRAFTQDDAHIFCTEDQITAESDRVLRTAARRSTAISASRMSAIKFSDRPAHARRHATRSGTAPRRRCARPVEAAGLAYTLNPGEGAFYGPKLEFVLRDAIGRDWQCGTLQVDFVAARAARRRAMSARTAQRHRPVMLHRAILGSLERFIGILIEHYAGRFPALAGARCRWWSRPSSRTPTPTPRQVAADAGAAGLARRNRSRQREDQLQGARAQPRQGAGHARRRPARGRDSAASRCAGSAEPSRKFLRSPKPLLD